MRLLLNASAPFYRLERLSEAWGVELWVKRDDLLPQYLGGNKVRKNINIVSGHVSRHGMPDIMVTNGGVGSNHARVVALIGAQLGCRVELVLHGGRPGESAQKGNAFFYRSAGARAHYVDPIEISDKITHIVDAAISSGRSVLAIPGGGHHPDGAHAYSEAIGELPFAPEAIVHASGTGGTQAGLVAGIKRAGWETRVLGISVARPADRGIDEIVKLLPVECSESDVIFLDDYRFGGYGKHATSLLELIDDVVKKEGLPLDPTYTGKAMYALRDLVMSGLVSQGERVVFWHTGGFLNSQACQP